MPDITDAHGTTYKPMTGPLAGFEITLTNGDVRYLYLNPSSETEDGAPNVFVYIGHTGDPSKDSPVTHITID